MKRTDEFAKDMCKQLRILTGVPWSCGRKIGSSREAVDAYGELGGTPVYIEVELRRDEPLTNIVKLWRAIEEKHVPKNLILVHAFSRHYSANNRRENLHRANAEFAGKQMQQSCGTVYVPLSFPYRPTKGGKVGGDYRRRNAIGLARRVIEALKKRKLLN